jgi:hypothetical protein
MGYKSTKHSKEDPSTDGLAGLPSASKNGEDTTLVSECESHCNASASSSSTTNANYSSVEAEIWEMLSSSSTGEHDDVDGERDWADLLAVSTTANNEEIEFEVEVVDKDVLDVLVLGDSDSFRLLSPTPEQKEASTKRSLFQDGAGREDIDDKLQQMHEKRARLEASVFASPPDQHYAALQDLRRKRPVCLFVNFLGTRCPQEENAKLLSSRTRVITTETRVSSLKVLEFPESEPSDLPTKSVSLITTVSKKFDAPSPYLVTPEGLKMLEALGLGICPCKMKMNKKHSTMSFQASKDPSLASCCFPALPLTPLPLPRAA